MTLIVSNGQFLYADKLCSITGRAPGQPAGKQYKTYVNDVCKIKVFDKPALVYGRRCLAMSLSGNTAYQTAIHRHLDAGDEFEELVRYECVTGNLKMFKSGIEYVFLMEDGLTRLVHTKDDSIKSILTSGIVTSGATHTYLNHIDVMCPKGQALTPLEMMVLSSRHSKSVSEEFDYYSAATGQLVMDQKLSDRQAVAVIERVNARLRIDT